MASTFALGPCTLAVLAVLKNDMALAGIVSTRIYPNSSGDVPQKLTYPYVQVESVSEIPFNTLGPPSSAKWGSTATIQVRSVSRSRSEAQSQKLMDIVKQALDGQPITVAGYGSAAVDYTRVTMLTDFEGGIVTREWLAEFDVMVHQGA